MSHSSLAAVAEAAAAIGTSSAKTDGTSPPITPDPNNSAAVSEAETKGREAGASAERDRLSAVLSSDGIAGNAERMGHAMELAVNAPGMAADKVVELTTKHVSAAAPVEPDASLANRKSDADPLGAAAGSDTVSAKPGLDVGAIYNVHNNTSS